MSLAVCSARTGGVEVHLIGVSVMDEAAPRREIWFVHNFELQLEKSPLARRGHRGAARRLGVDPHEASRALVAPRGTVRVRTCAPGTSHLRTGSRSLPQLRRALPYTAGYRKSTLHHPTTLQMPTAQPAHALECHRPSGNPATLV